MARASALALALILGLQAFGAAEPASAAAAWGRPFRVAGPVALDLLPAQLAFSADGSGAIGFGVQDEDNPSTSSAFTALRGPRGRLPGQQQVPGAQEILGLAFAGPSLQVLVGTSPRGQSCCSSARVLRAQPGGGLGRGRTLVGGLAGATEGRLVALAGRVLAAIATERGVWAAQSSGSGVFAPTHRLSLAGQMPQALDATSLPGGGTIVVWTASSPSTGPVPHSVYFATGTLSRAPRGHAVAVTVAAGHRIDELAVAPGPRAPTIAWIESWFDSAGAYHSQAMAADLRGGAPAQRISPAVELASGLAFAADLRGDQALAWMACSSLGPCLARAVLRPAGRRYGPARTLGAVDAGEDPSVALAPDGRAIIGWLGAGHVLAAASSRGAGRLGPAHTISNTGFAADLTLAFGPLGQALAVWTQGTLAQSLLGAVYTAG